MRLSLYLLAAGSAVVLIRVLLAAPEYERVPVLENVVDGGKMEEFLEQPGETELIVDWVSAGAPEAQWESVASVFAARCTTCHHSDASFDMLPLDRFEPAASAARVRPLLAEKISGGTMGKYLDGPDAQKRLLRFIEEGAYERDWPDAKQILDAHCVHCHNPEGVQGIISLTRYSSVARLARLPEPTPPAWQWPAALLALSLAGSIVHRAKSA